jgi:hypothetical protein
VARIVPGDIYEELGDGVATVSSFGSDANCGLVRLLSGNETRALQVMVHRFSPTEWVVSTDASTLVPEVENPAVLVNTGAISELLRSGKRDTLVFLANYPMPFQATVTCPTCTP